MSEMRATRGSPIWLLGALALVVSLTIVMGASAAATRHTATLANSVTFQDSTGEDANALDIGTVTVSNDDTGLLTFHVKFVNASISSASDVFFIVMNTDRDDSTGEPNTLGGDWVIGWDGSPVLLQWDGTKLVLGPSMKSLFSMVEPNGLVVKLDPSEIGGVKGFDFYAKTYRPDPSDEEGEFSDWAPDNGMWSYDIKLYVAPVLAASAIKCTPDPPKAGKPMVASMTVAVTRGGQAEQLGSNGVVKATASVAGRRIVGKVLPTSPTGRVAVRWIIPKSAKGKMLRGKVTVTLEKVSVTRTFADHVK